MTFSISLIYFWKYNPQLQSKSQLQRKCHNKRIQNKNLILYSFSIFIISRKKQKAHLIMYLLFFKLCIFYIPLYWILFYLFQAFKNRSNPYYKEEYNIKKP